MLVFKKIQEDLSGIYLTCASTIITHNTKILPAFPPPGWLKGTAKCIQPLKLAMANGDCHGKNYCRLLLRTCIVFIILYCLNESKYVF